jgi:hypothetical protein
MSLDTRRAEVENSHQTAIELISLRDTPHCRSQQPSEQPPNKNGHLLSAAFMRQVVDIVGARRGN